MRCLDGGGTSSVARGEWGRFIKVGMWKDGSKEDFLTELFVFGRPLGQAGGISGQLGAQTCSQEQGLPGGTDLGISTSAAGGGDRLKSSR